MQNGVFLASASVVTARGLEQEDGGDLECLVSTVAGSQEAQSGPWFGAQKLTSLVGICHSLSFHLLGFAGGIRFHHHEDVFTS